MLSQQLKQLRNKQGMSQKHLADMLGISQQTVAKWEMGYSSPKPETLKQLTEIFNVSSDYLLGIMPKISDADLICALFGKTEGISDEMLSDVKQFAAFLMSQQKKA